MIEQKKNDWLATRFFSPDKTLQDLANLGITTDNSSLQEKDYYKKIPQIQEAFKTDSGNFDDFKFDKYYQDILTSYNEADNAKLVSTIMDSYNYDPYDYFAPIGSKVRDVSSKFVQFANPERRSRGLTNLRETSAPTMSLREVAQQNKVFNVETQQFEDWTPNSRGFWKSMSPWSPTLVFAQWDEDGTHEVNRRIVSHKAGDLKFNEKGDPFYETLGNRSLAGKDILHASDVLTVDGTKWNRYDVFDADGLDKSVGGTIAKTLFKIAPIFIPGAGAWYGGITATIELGKLLPVLYKSIEGIATGDISESASAQNATNIQGYFSRFDGSLSDKGRQSFFNLENVGKLIGDSSMQLFQQKTISKIPTWFTEKGKQVSENAAKWGQGLAITYMAGTSSTEAYDAFKEAGANDRVAGLGMISVMGAMFSLMNNDYFKDFWFKDTYLDRTKVRSVIKESADQLSKKEFAKKTLEQTSSAKGAAQWVMNMQKAITNRISKLKPGDLIHDSFNEGIEETVEEITTDAVKAFYSGLNALGLADKGKNYDFGITPEDMFSRYTTSFVGGAIGGAVFSLQKKWESRKNPALSDAIKDGGDGLKEMIYLLRSGKEFELRKELDRLYNAGKLASTNLSGTEFELVKDGSTHKIQYKAAEVGNSQNDLLYKQMNFFIDRVNEVIKEEGLDISDAELQYITEQSEISGQTFEQTRQNYLDLRNAIKQQTVTEQIIDSGIYSQLFEDWNDLTSQIVQTKVELERMLTPEDTESKTPKDIEDKIAAMSNNSEYRRLKAKLDTLRAERDAIINGEKNDFYTGQLLFAANPQLVNNFVSGFGIHNFTKYKYNKNYDTLTADEKAKVDSEYADYSSKQEKNKVLTAYNIFTQMQEKLTPTIIDVAQRIKDSSGVYLAETTQYKLIYEQVNKLIKKKRDELDEALKALPDGVDTTDEINKLRHDIQALELYLNSVQNFKFEVLNPALSESGKQILMRPDLNDKGVLAFENYADSYKHYLEYLINNGLFLDLVDSDLASILQSYVALNDLTENTFQDWVSRVQHTLVSDYDIQLDSNDQFILNLASPLVTIIEDIKRNDITAALNDYEHVSNIPELDVDAESLQINLDELLSKLMPRIGGDTFINYLKEIKNLKSQISSSPAYDLIDAASKVAEVDNTEILNLIKSEQTNFLNAKSVEDYIIRDSQALTKLKETKQLIDAISAVLDASVEGGYNSQLNPFRESLQKELLPIISTETDVNIVKDLNRIATQIQTLIDISERNQSQKLREQKDIAINMRGKFIDLLTKNDSLIKENFAKEFGVDLDTLIKDLDIPANATEENYKEFEEASIKLETEIFKQVDKYNLSSTEIAQKLVGLFNPQNIINGKPTKLSKNKDTVITDFDQLVYLATILATPSQNFYNDLQGVVSNPEFTNAPIFSQEYAVRVGYSQILNKELFNSIITQIKSLAESTSTDEYIQTKSPLSNFITIYGGAGVGKTKGVAYLLKLMIPDATIITSAPTRKQTDNLSKSIQHDGGSFTKNELIEKILGRPLNESYIKPISNVSITSDISLDVNTDNIFGDAKNKVLFIDEISWYNRIELELISKWARKNNVNVVATGDYKQNASYVMYDHKRIDCGIEDTFVIKTPDLIAPLRPNNIAKYDNYTRLATALDAVYEEYYNNPTISPSVLNDFTKQYLMTNKIELKYFEDTDTFGGEKIVPENDVLNHIDKLKRLSDDVAIITDHPEKYNTVNGVKIVPLNSVQGDEFDYVIIDKSFDLDENGAGRGDYYKLKDIYTLTQRSRKGTVIVDTGLNNITSKLDQTSSGSIEMPQSQIDKFKNWRLDLLANISNETINWEPKEIDMTIQNEEEGTQEEEEEEDKHDDDDSGNLEEKKATEEPDTDIPPAISPTEEKTASSAPQSSEPKTVTNVSSSSAKSTVALPPILPNDVVGKAIDYIDFIQKDLLKYYKTSENSLSKNLKLTNPGDIKTLTYLLRSYFCYGYYKNSTPELTMRSKDAKKRLLAFVRDLKVRGLGSKVKDLLDLPHQFFIIPYNGKGLLVAKLGQTDIPLLITDPQIGPYNGDIEIASKLQYIVDAPNTYQIRLSDFINSEINTEQMFRVFRQPAIFAVTDEELSTFDDSQKQWVNSNDKSKSNNGRTFFVVSGDPFMDDSAFKDFLKPTIVDNKVTWTTQHNDAMAIIGMNWVTDFNSIITYSKTHSKNKHANSIINGQRAGQIVGIAYKVAPNIVAHRIKQYLKGKDTVRVKIGNDFVSDAEEVDTILNKYKDQDFDITFGYIKPDGKFVTDFKGEWTINRIFENRKDSENFDQSQLNEIDRLCKESKMFKQGVYAKDIWEGNINGFYRSTNLEHDYVTNCKTLIGNDFKIDGRKIGNSEPAPNTELIDRLNEQLKTLGIDKIVSDQSNIESTIDNINEDIKSTITTPEFEILSFDGNNIIKVKISDMRYMISNYLKIPLESVNISSSKTSKFVPFSVSLQDKINNFVAEQKNGDWTIREFPIMNEYTELFEFAKANKDLIKNDTNVTKYITELLNNKEIDLKTAENYWNVISVNPAYESTTQQVDKYLMSKLMNNEC